MSLAQSKMQTVLSRIWTHVSDSISYDDPYTKYTFLIYNVDIMLNWTLCVYQDS